jgi:hypothetical protein
VRGPQRLSVRLGCALVSALIFASSSARAEKLPGTIDDREFWRMVTDLSEPGGVFQQEFMSNEDSVQVVVPSLKATTRKGGVYIGVGPEQNFTYIAAIQPALAVVVDIRRDNMLEHLMYKALFERSLDRADFLSSLFSRKRPTGLDANSSVKALFDAYQAAEADSTLYEENLRAVMGRLVSEHNFQLSDADRTGVARIMNAFRVAGPYNLKGSGDKNLTYAQAMTATDPTGGNQSYLASEGNFRIVQELERKNLIVPLVGDFAGDKTLMSVGRYLKEHDATVNVFYVSNVERYLFNQGDHGRQFYSNVAALPRDRSSAFVRSVTTDISERLGIQLPHEAVNWWSFLSPIADCLNALADGRIQTYRDLFDTAR